MRLKGQILKKERQKSCLPSTENSMNNNWIRSKMCDLRMLPQKGFAQTTIWMANSEHWWPNSNVNSPIADGSFRKQKHHRLRQWPTPATICSYRFGRTRGPQPDSLTVPTPASPSVKNFTLHFKPSPKRYQSRWNAHSKAVVLWACKKHVLTTSTYYDSLSVRKTGP